MTNTKLEYKAELIEDPQGDIHIENGNYVYDFQVQLYEDSRKLSPQNYLPAHHAAVNSVKKDALEVCTEAVLSELRLHQPFPPRITVESEITIDSDSKN